MNEKYHNDIKFENINWKYLFIIICNKIYYIITNELLCNEIYNAIKYHSERNYEVWKLMIVWKLITENLTCN